MALRFPVDPDAVAERLDAAASFVRQAGDTAAQIRTALAQGPARLQEEFQQVRTDVQRASLLQQMLPFVLVFVGILVRRPMLGLVGGAVAYGLTQSVTAPPRAAGAAGTR